MDDELLRDLFATVGPDLRIRRMFGGQGVYDGERIIAAVVDGELFLKSDERTAPFFEAAGCPQWTYARQGKATVAMPYHRWPEAAFDEPDIAAEWIERAREAAGRAAKLKSGPRITVT